MYYAKDLEQMVRGTDGCYIVLGVLLLMFNMTHSGEGTLQFTVCDVAITVYIKFFESPHQLRFIRFLLML